MRVSFTLVVREDTERPREGLVLTVEARKGRAVTAEGEWKRLRSLALKTNASGRASVDLYPGAYEVTVLDGSTKREDRFTVPTRSGGVHEVVVPSQGGVVRGRVVERGTGKSVVGRPVYVSYQDRSRARGWLGSAVTDAEGLY